jgi:predicted ester cyclase
MSSEWPRENMATIIAMASMLPQPIPDVRFLFQKVVADHNQLAPVPGK